MRTTEMLLFAHFLKTSKFIPACISIYILSLPGHPIVLILKHYSASENRDFTK